MNGNSLFDNRGHVPPFTALVDGSNENLGHKIREISAADTDNNTLNRDFPVIFAKESNEEPEIQDGVIEEDNEQGESVHNLATTAHGVIAIDDQFSDDEILMFVDQSSCNNNSNVSTVTLDSSFLGSPNSVILPTLEKTMRPEGKDAVEQGNAPDGLCLDQRDAVSLLLPMKSPVKPNYRTIDTLNTVNKMMNIHESDNSSEDPSSMLDLVTAGGAAFGIVQDLNLDQLVSGSSINEPDEQSVVGISQGEIIDISSSSKARAVMLQMVETKNTGEALPELPTQTSNATMPVDACTSGISVSNSNQLELNVTTLPAGDASIGQPVMYVITSCDRDTGTTQRFQVAVGTDSLSSTPIGRSTLGPKPLSEEFAVPSSSLKVQDGKKLNVQLQHSALGGSVKRDYGSFKDPLNLVNTGEGDNTSVISAQSIQLQDQPKNAGDFAGYRPNKKSMKEKLSEQDLTCSFEECREVFTSKMKLKIHQLMHADDRPYKCNIDGCGWAFPTLYKLRRHEVIHGGERPFRCDECTSTFSTIYNLKMHMKRHERSKAFVCDYKDCDMTFHTANKLKCHQLVHYPDRRIKCAFINCDKTFTSQTGMLAHQRIHKRSPDEMTFPCLLEGCGKVYNKACRLKLHMRSHTGERPYKCTAEGCSWSFTCVQKLSRHMVQHTGDRKYLCQRPGCNKLFTRLEHLKNHHKTHTGEKPFICNYKGCDSRFGARSSLYMHIRRHKEGYTAKRKNHYNCPMDDCELSYTSKEGLKKHILTVHSVMLPSCHLDSSGKSELVYIPTENPQAMVDAMTDPGLLQNPTVVHITQTGENSCSGPTNQLVVNPSNRDAPGVAVCASPSQPNVLVPYSSVGLIVDSSGAPVSFINSLPGQDGSPPKLTAGGLHHVNYSGSARTDFLYRHNGKKGRLSGESEGDGVLGSSFIPSSFSITTSASLTLRDPVTGARYVQTQLLQDDPPDESELAFHLIAHPTTSDPSDLNVLPILPVNDPRLAQCPSSSTVNFLQAEQEMDSTIDGFRESTINLQDLE